MFFPLKNVNDGKFVANCVWNIFPPKHLLLSLLIRFSSNKSQIFRIGKGRKIEDKNVFQRRKCFRHSKNHPLKVTMLARRNVFCLYLYLLKWNHPLEACVFHVFAKSVYVFLIFDHVWRNNPSPKYSSV